MKRQKTNSFEKKYNIRQLHMKEPRLHVPLLPCSWLQGFINGRTGTAAADSTSAVQSGYIQAFLASYHTFTTKKSGNLSAAITTCYASLTDLLFQYHQLENAPALPPGSAEAIRAEHERIAQRTAVLRDMIRLQALLLQNIARYNCDVEASANRLSRSLASYCKGVLFRKPVRPESLPILKINYCDLNRDFPELKPVLHEISEILTISGSKEAAKNGQKFVV